MVTISSTLLRSTIIVGGLNFLSFSLSFAVNMFSAALFGAGKTMDIYFVATTIPLYIVTILTGVLSYTFIPVFSEIRLKDNSPWKIVNVFLNLATILLCIICILGVVYARDILRITAHGFIEEDIGCAAVLLQLFFPVIIFGVVNELIASVYYAHEKFLIPLLNKLITPLITITFLVFFSQTLNIKSLIFAQLTGSILQCIILFIGLIKNIHFHYKFTFTIYMPEIKQVFKLMLPLILCSLLTKIVPVFDRFILSGLPSGSISYVTYANKIYLAISSIMTSVFSVQIFSLLSNYAAENKYDEMKILFVKVTRILLYIAIPSTFIIVFFGEIFVKLLYERGAFISENTEAVYNCLKLYALSLPVVVVGGIISYFYYALKNTFIIMIVGIIEILLYIILCFALLKKFDYLTIPIAYTIYFTFSTICLSLILRKKVKAKGIMLFKEMAKCLLMSMIAFIPIFLIKKMLPFNIVQTDFLSIVLGLLLYFFLSFIFKIEEFFYLLNKFNDLKTKFVKI